MRIDHLNMCVTDLSASVAWYGELFGFIVVEKGITEDGTNWVILRADEAMLAMYEYPERERYGINHFGLNIDDADAWLAKAASMGVEILYGGLVKWPHSRAWYVQDPSGWEIEVVSWDGGVISFDKVE